ncbi:hypothetical protein ACROYT_G044160 [Oculina patagonica]
MGSPVSAILANLVMEYVEEKALSSAPHPPKWWFRYVDDSHVCLKKEFVDEFHSHLNSINQHIKFTIEVETEGSIAFLDTKTTRQVDGSIAVSVYRKATHTDRYLDFNSYHHTQHKHSVVRTLMDRAKNIPSTEEEVSSESKRVLKALAANNYPINFIRNGRQSNAEQKSGANVVEQRGLVVLPYAKGFSERISRVLKGFNVKVAHKPIRSIANILKKPKDKISEESSKGVVYKIKCKDCACVYIGQTSRALKTRIKEHAKAITTMDRNSLLAEHHLLNDHEIDLENVDIIDRSSVWRQRLFLEAWHSVRDGNAINEHRCLTYTMTIALIHKESGKERQTQENEAESAPHFTQQKCGLFSSQTNETLQNIATKDLATLEIDQDLSIGQTQLGRFVERRLLSSDREEEREREEGTEEKFRDPICKNNPPIFANLYEVKSSATSSEKRNISHAKQSILSCLVTVYEGGDDVNI